MEKSVNNYYKIRSVELARREKILNQLRNPPFDPVDRPLFGNIESGEKAGTRRGALSVAMIVADEAATMASLPY